MRAPVSLVLAVLLSLAFLPSVCAAQSPGPASRFLELRHNEVNRLMAQPASPTRSQSVTRILSELLDYEELSRRALGAHWESRTPAQREQFVSLLRRLVERNYEANLERIREFAVSYTGEEPTAGGTVVRTEARSRTERRQPPVEIAYSMHLDGTVWRVFDVVTDGVSLVRNYQSQFNRIIASSGWDELIRRMEQRLAAGGTE